MWVIDIIFLFIFIWAIITACKPLFVKNKLQDNSQNNFPFNNLVEKECRIEMVSSGETPEVIVKSPYFDVSKIKEYTKTESKKFIYRPQNLEEYIGQEKAKDNIKLSIREIKELGLCHFLISGHRGCGKTTLAHIIKNLLEAKMIERIAGELTDPNQIIEILNNDIYNSENDYNILFIDEIHNLKPSLCESFYPLMEDFKIGGKRIRPFILIGATTEKNILVNKVAPFVDRFQVPIELEKYTAQNIMDIITQYKKQMYPDKDFDTNNYPLIADNCKFTPRIAIALLKKNLIEKDIKKIFQAFRIIKNGLTDIDYKILQILIENQKAIGEDAMAQRIGISRADYRTVYEPFLAEQGYILRTSRGRTISEKGKELLKEIK